MKIRAVNLLIMSTRIVCKSDGESADLLRNPRKEPCAKACGNPVGIWRISGGTLVEKDHFLVADTAV
jgi:hypothetical protein